MIPWASVAGGALIGAGASVLLAVNGRVAGITGILGELTTPRPGEVGWRLMFLAGLVGGAQLARAATGAYDAPMITSSSGLIAAGVAVGFGTRLANGCTSGHGVCGLPRGSARSWAATITFMGVGALAVAAGRVAGIWP